MRENVWRLRDVGIGVVERCRFVYIDLHRDDGSKTTIDRLQLTGRL